MSNRAAAQLIGQMTENLLNALDAAEAKTAEVQNFLNTLVPGIKSGELTADRIQVMENGDLRILPAPPAENGSKGDVKDAVPLADQKEDAEPKLEAVSDN